MTKLEFPVHKSRYRFAISATGRIKKARRRPLLHTACRSRRTSLKRRRYGNEIFAQLERQVWLLAAADWSTFMSRPFQGNVIPRGGGGGNEFRCATALKESWMKRFAVSVASAVLQNDLCRCDKKLREKKRQRKREVVDRWKGSRGRFVLVVNCSRRSGNDSRAVLCKFFAEMCVWRLFLFPLYSHFFQTFSHFYR